MKRKFHIFTQAAETTSLSKNTASHSDQNLRHSTTKQCDGDLKTGIPSIVCQVDKVIGGGDPQDF